MSDLVERLRNNQQHAPMINHAGEIYGLEKSLDALAAAEIERLTQQRDELLATLKGVYADAQAQDKLFEWWGPMRMAIAKAES